MSRAEHLTAIDLAERACRGDGDIQGALVVELCAASYRAGSDEAPPPVLRSIVAMFGPRPGGVAEPTALTLTHPRCPLCGSTSPASAGHLGPRCACGAALRGKGGRR